MKSLYLCVLSCIAHSAAYFCRRFESWWRAINFLHRPAHQRLLTHGEYLRIRENFFVVSCIGARCIKLLICLYWLLQRYPIVFPRGHFRGLRRICPSCLQITRRLEGLRWQVAFICFGYSQTFVNFLLLFLYFGQITFDFWLQIDDIVKFSGFVDGVGLRVADVLEHAMLQILQVFLQFLRSFYGPLLHVVHLHHTTVNYFVIYLVDWLKFLMKQVI